MAWTVYGDSYDTDSEFSNAEKTVMIKFNKNVILRAVRSWIVFYNDPGLTNITMKLYYDEGDVKGDLIASSTTTHTKAQLLTLDNGVKEAYWEFDDIALDGDNYYHLALTGTSSGFSDSSHIAWKTSYPYPVYQDGVAINFQNLPKFPYTCVIIGAEF